MATEIPLTRGLITIVDDADAAWLGLHKWSSSKCHRNKSVAMRRVGGRTVYMHREILGLTHGDGMEADHLNHDTLDNQRTNLLAVSPLANKRRQPSRGGSSSYIGVTFDTDRNRWRAQIQIDGRGINLGRFHSEIEAAAARDAYVLKNNTGHGLNGKFVTHIGHTRSGTGY